MRNEYTLLVLVVHLEPETPEIRRVAALRADPAGPVVPFELVAGIVQPFLGNIMVALVLAAVETFGGCGRCADCGDDDENGGDLHVEEAVYGQKASDSRCLDDGGE